MKHEAIKLRILSADARTERPHPLTAYRTITFGITKH
jgi:hypothetical protein